MHPDEILLRLKRKYSRDEEFKLILQELSEAKVLIGQYKSEVEHLNYLLQSRAEQPLTNHEKKELKKLQEKNQELIAANETLRQQLRNSEAGKNLTEKNQKLIKDNKSLRNDVKTLVNKIIQLEKKLEQHG